MASEKKEWNLRAAFRLVSQPEPEGQLINLINFRKVSRKTILFRNDIFFNFLIFKFYALGKIEGSMFRLIFTFLIKFLLDSLLRLKHKKSPFQLTMK